MVEALTENVTYRDAVICDGVFAEAYYVNNLGEVWSKDRYVTVIRYGKEYKIFLKGKKLKLRLDKKGYPVVFLRYNGNVKNVSVHQIIANAFPEICGTWFPGAHIDHKDGNKLNNRPENLWYCTPRQNANNPITKGKSSKSNINNPLLSKPVRQFTKDGTFVAEYPSIAEAHRQTGIANALISIACNCYPYRCAGGYKWLF